MRYILNDEIYNFKTYYNPDNDFYFILMSSKS